MTCVPADRRELQRRVPLCQPFAVTCRIEPGAGGKTYSMSRADGPTTVTCCYSIEDVEEGRKSLRDRMRHSESRVKRCERIRKEARGLSPSLKGNAVGVPIAGKATGGDNIAIVGFNVTVDNKRSSLDVLYSEDADFWCVDGLDVTRAGGVEGLVVDNRRGLEKVVDWRRSKVMRFTALLTKEHWKGQPLPVR